MAGATASGGREQAGWRILGQCCPSRTQPALAQASLLFFFLVTAEGTRLAEREVRTLGSTDGGRSLFSLALSDPAPSPLHHWHVTLLHATTLQHPPPPPDVFPPTKLLGKKKGGGTYQAG